MNYINYKFSLFKKIEKNEVAFRVIKINYRKSIPFINIESNYVMIINSMMFILLEIKLCKKNNIEI